jgi:hypothetical protein
MPFEAKAEWRANHAAVIARSKATQQSSLAPSSWIASLALAMTEVASSALRASTSFNFQTATCSQTRHRDLAACARAFGQEHPTLPYSEGKYLWLCAAAFVRAT